jgi:hypothetical protein
MEVESIFLKTVKGLCIVDLLTGIMQIAHHDIAPSLWTCMCRFWVHSSNWWVVLKSTRLLVGFLFKIWMLDNWFNHASTSFYFVGVLTWLFVSWGFVSLWNIKTIHRTNFQNEICLINIQIISLNTFKSYWNEILKKVVWKIMEELIKIKQRSILD